MTTLTPNILTLFQLSTSTHSHIHPIYTHSYPLHLNPFIPHTLTLSYHFHFNPFIPLHLHTFIPHSLTFHLNTNTSILLKQPFNPIPTPSFTLHARSTVVHVIGPVLVLAESPAIASLVAATTSLCSTTTTVPTVLHVASNNTQHFIHVSNHNSCNHNSQYRGIGRGGRGWSWLAVGRDYGPTGCRSPHHYHASTTIVALIIRWQIVWMCRMTNEQYSLVHTGGWETEILPHP